MMKAILTDYSPYWTPHTLELIKQRSQELFFKITKHYGDSRNFLYRKF